MFPAIGLLITANAQAQTTERVSVSSEGEQTTASGNNVSADSHLGSGQHSVSGDGTIVVFRSNGENLVQGKTKNKSLIYIRDRVAGTTEKISKGNGDIFSGNFTNSSNSAISADGNVVVFSTHDGKSKKVTRGNANKIPKQQIYIFDRATGTTEIISVATDGTKGNAESDHAAINEDGTVVAFWSRADNLVAGDTNGQEDIFVRDRVAGTTTRVNIATDSTQANQFTFFPPSISANGNVIAFASNADNLVAGDTNSREDIFVHDLVTGITTRVNVASDGTQANLFSSGVSMSADGNLIAFGSLASNLIIDDINGFWDYFIHDRTTAITTRINVDNNGSQTNSLGFKPILSADGNTVGFVSILDGLVENDTNGTWDVFVHDRLADTIERVSVATDGAQANDLSAGLSLSADGTTVVFKSIADNLVAGDTNNAWDVFAHDR